MATPVWHSTAQEWPPRHATSPTFRASVLTYVGHSSHFVGFFFPFEFVLESCPLSRGKKKKNLIFCILLFFLIFLGRPHTRISPFIFLKMKNLKNQICSDIWKYKKVKSKLGPMVNGSGLNKDVHSHLTWRDSWPSSQPNHINGLDCIPK